MKIKLPEYFNKNTVHNSLSIDDFTFVKYNLCKSQNNLYVLLKSNLLIIAISGTKIIKLDNEYIELTPGDMIFLKSSSSIMNQIINKENGIYESFLIFISDDFLIEFINKNMNLFNNIDSNNYKKNYHIFDITPLLKTSIEAVFPYLLHHTEYTKEILSLKLHELLYNLINHDKFNVFKKILVSLMLNNNLSLKLYMENNYLKPLNQTDFAKLTGRSLTKFKIDFKNTFNTTFKIWINKKRLERSKFLLEKSNHSITEIGYFCGFENLSNFIQLFKNEYGITPKQYQMNIKMS